MLALDSGARAELCARDKPLSHGVMEFTDASISIEWTASPADTCLGGYCQALFRAQQECAQLLAAQEETRNVLSATYQKEKTQAEAYEQWASEWHRKPRTSITYRLSLLTPLSGNNHPLWVATDKAKPTRSSFCTALRLAVGHVFVSEYTHRFKRDFEPLDIIYECISGERTLAHLIFDCELPTRARDEANIDTRTLILAALGQEPQQSTVTRPVSFDKGPGPANSCLVNISLYPLM